MGGFCGAISNRDVVLDVYFGTDYHSHLGTRRGGMAAWDPELGFQREIHNIENAPFRTKFDKTVGEMVGQALYRQHQRHRPPASVGALRPRHLCHLRGGGH